MKVIGFDNLQNGKQEIEISLPPLKGEYQISLSATGEKCACARSVVKTFERKVFPWEHNNLGKSAKVYAPFTPIQIKNNHISTVLREHQMSGAGLWNGVKSLNTEILSAPMRYEVSLDGKSRASQKNGFRIWTKTAPNEAKARGQFSVGTIER